MTKRKTEATHTKQRLNQQRGKQSYHAGRLAETLAVFILMLKGYRIIGTRMRTPYGEIDIAALKQKTLVIIEVKKRGSSEEAGAAISTHQQHRLVQAGQAVAQKLSALPQTIRCDAMLFTRRNPWPQHIQNAFYTNGSK